ncbi:MAG: DUF4159 domain-containing protein [Gemmatimonadota bacterium]|jgi:hypothetical protein|nr:DUF4159 domain-containing protein [Gemmatimonadota bacterium]
MTRRPLSITLPRVLLAALLLLATAVVVGAQAISYGVPPSSTGLAIGEVPHERPGFNVCRLMYRSVTQEALGSGWTTDYPAAERNLLIRIEELTLIHTAKSEDREPLHAVVRPTDPALFECPFIIASDIGTVGFLGAEIEPLRQYFLKGGFLWVDDFWGPVAFNRFSAEIGRILPGLPIVEIPLDHPIFKTFLEIEGGIPQIPAISFWITTQQVAERGTGNPARMYGIFDEKGRMVVLMTHNTDIADGWEREGESVEYFERFSPGAYAVGLNAVIWMLTH